MEYDILEREELFATQASATCLPTSMVHVHKRFPLHFKSNLLKGHDYLPHCTR